MRNWMKAGLAAAAVAALSLAAPRGGGSLPAIAQTGGFSDGQVKSIEKIIKDYLLSHPEFLLEVQKAYEDKVEAQRADAAQARLPGFYNTLAGLRPELASMKIGRAHV